MTHEFKAFTDARAQIPGSALAGLGAALRNTAAVRRAVPAILFTILLFGADAMRVAHADGLTRGTAAYSRGDYVRAVNQLSSMALPPISTRERPCKVIPLHRAGSV